MTLTIINDIITYEQGQNLGKLTKNGERKMLKTILMNEVRDALGRNPTAKEFKRFVDYINDALLDEERAGKLNQVFLTNISLWVIEYRNGYYRQCADCGEYFLIGSDDWNDDGIYCVNCKANIDPDMLPGGHDYY